MENLHQIGLRHQTDKATIHGFCDFYDNYFRNIRFDNLRILEVGVLDGASLKMWHDYFPNSEIIGVDIFEKTQFDNDRIKTYIVNQEVKEDLLNIPGDFDIIIDDGGHTMLQQQVTLSAIFDKVKNGGFYVVEDLHTSFSKDFWEIVFGNTLTNNTYRLLMDLKFNNKTSNDYFISDNDFSRLVGNIDYLDFYKSDYNSHLDMFGYSHSLTSIIKKSK